MKRNDRFIWSIYVLNGEVRFTKILNGRCTDDLHVIRCSSVPVRYHVIFGVLVVVPTKSVENILEGMNHRFFICCVCD